MKLKSYPTVRVNIIQIERASYLKQLGILLDVNLNFKQYIDSVILKINKGMSLIKKLRYSFPRKSMLTIYKTFFKIVS